jgi:hypothetical protein
MFQFLENTTLLFLCRMNMDIICKQSKMSSGAVGASFIYTVNIRAVFLGIENLSSSKTL